MCFKKSDCSLLKTFQKYGLKKSKKKLFNLGCQKCGNLFRFKSVMFSHFKN